MQHGFVGRPIGVSYSALSPPRWWSVWAWPCWYSYRAPSAAARQRQRWPSLRGLLPRGKTSNRTTRRSNERSRRSRPRLRHPSASKTVPSNLDPSLSDAVKRPTDPTGCELALLEVHQPECATGDTSSTTTVALIGDSNAAMWVPAFQQVAAQRQWRLESLSKSGCPMLDLPFYNVLLRRTYTECERVARSDHCPVTE